MNRKIPLIVILVLLFCLTLANALPQESGNSTGQASNEPLRVPVTVSSIEALIPYLDDDNVKVRLAPGTYNIDKNDSVAKNPIFCISGSNSTYDFTGATINIDTDVLSAHGGVDYQHMVIVGNNSLIKNLKLIDDGSVYDRPGRRATNIALEGRHNVIDGLYMETRGSWPYGYGDLFGKSSTYIIKHYKHSSLKLSGDYNTIRNCKVYHYAYGHGYVMQAAQNPTIENCYMEGEVRSTDEMLAETSGPAYDRDFMARGGRLKPGMMKSTGEEGIRAYNRGDCMINGKRVERGTDNITVKNTTVKYMRGGVTLTLSDGFKYVEGCTAIGCESGFKVGTGGKVVDCYGDCQYGPVFAVDYTHDKGIPVDITMMPYSGEHVNYRKHMARIIGGDHNVTIRGVESNPDQDLKFFVGGDDNVVNNLTNYPMELSSGSSNNSGQSRGSITDNGSKNSVEKLKTWIKD